MTETGNVRWFSENTEDVPPAGANDDCQLSTVNFKIRSYIECKITSCRYYFLK